MAFVLVYQTLLTSWNDRCVLVGTNGRKNVARSVVILAIHQNHSQELWSKRRNSVKPLMEAQFYLILSYHNHSA